MSLFDDLKARQRKHLFYPWSVQEEATPWSVVDAKGVWLTTDDGREVLDFNSAIFNASVGHGHEGVRQAMLKACESPKVAHPNLVDEQKVLLAENLARIAPGDLNKTFLTLGGAEANENAIKIARMLTGRYKVVTRYRSYHGSTIALSNYAGDSRRIPFDGTVTGVVRFPDPYPRGSGQEIDTVRLLEEIIEVEGPQTISCVLLEGITGSNGVLIPPKDYWIRIRELCDHYGIMLIADEVLSGFGRTGKWFAIDHFDVLPDMITFAKGVTGGYAPLGGVIVREHIAKHFEKNRLLCGLTHYGHPFSCAVANAVIQAIESEGLLENATKRGEELGVLLRDMQESNSNIAEVRSIGLLAAIELENKNIVEASHLKKQFLDAGVYLTVRSGNVIFSPPLCISSDELQEGFRRVKQVLEKLVEKKI